MADSFTSLSALTDGLLIGAAAVLLAGIGRIAGMLRGLFAGEPGRGWRASFLIDLLAGAGIYLMLWSHAMPVRRGFPTALVIVDRLLVGAGTRLGADCTSGYGVCGIGRLSKRSLVATAVFMATGVLAAIVLRHVRGITP